MMNFSKPIEIDVIQFKNSSMSDPTFSDIEFKNKMTWVRLPLKIFLDQKNVLVLAKEDQSELIVKQVIHFSK